MLSNGILCRQYGSDTNDAIIKDMERAARHWGILSLDQSFQISPPSSSVSTLINKLSKSWALPPHRFFPVLSGVFEHLFDQRAVNEKKKLGQVFTPIGIVHRILDALSHFSNDADLKLILDFSCGTGNFIAAALSEKLLSLLDEIGSNISHKDKQNIPQFKLSLKKITDSLVAVDLDPLSCFATLALCHILLSHFYHFHQIAPEPFEGLLNSRIQIVNADFLLDDHFHQGCPFSHIIGNPPYLFSRDLDEDYRKQLKSIGYRTITGQYDLSDVFLERSIQLLALNGVLGVIIPESILVLQNHAPIRRIILENASHIQVIEVEATFSGYSVENILLFVQKNPTSGDVLVNWKEGGWQKFSRKHLLASPEANFSPISNINGKDSIVSDRVAKILEKISAACYCIDEWNLIHPKQQIEVFRGVELSKKGKIMQCPICKKWMPASERQKCFHCRVDLPKNIKSQEIVHKNAEEKNISQSHAPFIDSFAMEDPDLLERRAIIVLDMPGINYKDKSSYARERLVIRQLLANKRICAKRAPAHAYTSQSVYNIILPEVLMPYIEKLLQILQSDMLSFWNYVTFSHGKRLFPRILVNKLRSLPFIPRNLSSALTHNLKNDEYFIQMLGITFDASDLLEIKSILS